MPKKKKPATVATVGPATDPFTMDLFGGRRRGRAPTGSAMSSKERGRRFRNANFVLYISKEGFKDGFLGLARPDGEEGADDLAWRIGRLAAEGQLPRTGKIAELIRMAEGEGAPS